MAFGAGQHLLKLIENRDALDAQMAALKTERQEIEDAIILAGEPVADTQYKQAGKVDGTVRFALDNLIFKSDIRKTVNYDSKTLASIAGSIPWDEAQTIFKVEFSVSETAFKALPEGDLKQRITDARTAKYSLPKITVA